MLWIVLNLFVDGQMCLYDVKEILDFHINPGKCVPSGVWCIPDQVTPRPLKFVAHHMRIKHQGKNALKLIGARAISGV